jgi:hypothetical protein
LVAITGTRESSGTCADGNHVPAEGSEAQVSEQDLQQLKQQLLGAMPPDGTPIGNRSLLGILGWDPEQYQSVRGELIREGILRPGAGRGGSVRRQDLRRLRQQLLDALPAPGVSIGNKSLREKLGWDPDQYQQIRDELVREGAIQLGRGYGGSVRRVEEVEVVEITETSAQSTTGLSGYSRREQELYPAFYKCLQHWSKNQGWADHVVHQLAFQGRRYTGGSWTRPDFVVIGYRK